HRLCEAWVGAAAAKDGNDVAHGLKEVESNTAHDGGAPHPILDPCAGNVVRCVKALHDGEGNGGVGRAARVDYQVGDCPITGRGDVVLCGPRVEEGCREGNFVSSSDA